MTHSSDPDRPTFPDLRESIGEDPARYLHGREEWVARARIRGIRLRSTIRAWEAVERRLASREAREPRQWVLDALADREAFLEEHGEFDPEPVGLDPNLGPYPPELWEDRAPGDLPPITPHAENIAEPVTDGGESGE